jgi:long-chain fatty acid transport protein
MNCKLLTTAAIATVTLTWSAYSHAAGFRINEQGAKAMGMANAFAAQADDPSALYYNPAGIAFLKGTQISLGSLIIAVPQTEYNGTTPITGNLPLGNGASPVFEKAKRDLFISPSIYATYSLENMPLTFGLGVNSIYPLAKSWDSSGAFRNQIENISIKPINFQPTAAYRFDDWNLAVAAGLDVTHSIVTLQKSAHTSSIGPGGVGAPYGAFELGELGVDGTATDVGYNLGLLWKPRKDLSFGAAYRSEITLHITGDANFLATSPAGLSLMGIDYTTLPSSAIPFTRTRFTSTASTTITLPDSLTLAVAWKPLEKLTLEFDAERTGWSSYNKLEIAFDAASKLNAFNNKPSPKNWNDVWAYRVGGQYAYSKNIDLRAGYAYDTNPIPDATLGPELPDSDRHNVTMGMGIHNDNVALDCAYMWVHWVDRTSNNQDQISLSGQNGTFKSDAHLFAANITVKF